MQSNAFFNFATLIRDAGLLKDTIHFLNEKQLLTSPYITRYKLKQIKDIKNQINPYIDWPIYYTCNSIYLVNLLRVKYVCIHILKDHPPCWSTHPDFYSVV